MELQSQNIVKAIDHKLHAERSGELIRWRQLTNMLCNTVFILIPFFLDASESPATSIALAPIWPWPPFQHSQYTLPHKDPACGTYINTEAYWEVVRNKVPSDPDDTC
ncbi:hypothetical protein N7478_010687 [Penicillium angulare]|uniref:uncharacterized protein n=1 Tax=Penicillium angulare TaxID=116970 RepID=UPI00253F8BBD|nr:uncharacterized protein N7478_010687 [Penicillium angulare]KAJ5267879.1 hypothetical protein N7478_010687 [Penicillium angulare]